MKIASRIPAVPNKSYFAMNRWFYKMYLAGLLYHPDDAPDTIVNTQSGERTFTDKECVELNHAITALFDHHGDAVYECGLKYFHKAIGSAPDYSELEA